MSNVSDTIRRLFKESDDIRDAGLTTPEGIRRYDDIPYGADPRWQSLDVYRPKAAGEKTLPVIVSVHGGGWVYGDKERYQYYCMDLALRGFAVVNFTYRLAPEHKFPAPLEDTNSVFSWVLEHREQYGFDPERVFAVGDSAGAQLLGLYSCVCTNPAFAAKFPFAPPAGFVPRAIALNCGDFVINMEPGPDGTPGQTQLLMGELLPEKGSAREMELMNVLEHITSAFPSTFCMTATGDFLIRQPALLAARLTEVQVPFVYRFYGDADHSLGHVFHCNIRTQAARVCNDEECAFFKEYC